MSAELVKNRQIFIFLLLLLHTIINVEQTMFVSESRTRLFLKVILSETDERRLKVSV